MFNIIRSKQAANTPWDWSPLQISKREDGTWAVFNPHDQKTIRGFETAQAAESFAIGVAKNLKG